MSSPLTVRTSERNRDAFLFRLQGRQGKDLKPFMKAYFGAAAPPSDRKVNQQERVNPYATGG